MSIQLERDPKQLNYCARLACLAFGGALIIWGFAPGIVYALMHDASPPLDVLGMGTASFVLGAAFIMLYVFIGRGARWALAVAFSLGLIITTLTLITWLMTGSYSVSVFLLIMATVITATSWLALTAPATATPPPEQS